MQYKLSELGTTTSGTGFPVEEQNGDTGLPFYKVSDMNLSGNEIVMKNANHYVTEEQIFDNNWKPINKLPSIIFAKVGAALLLNRKRYVDHRFLIDNNMMAYSVNDDVNGKFVKYLFDTLFLPRYAQVGALPSINGKDIISIKVRMPIGKEQDKIGNTLSKLDMIITLEQEKVKKLEKALDFILRNILARSNEKTPNIRFKLYHNIWRTVKLKDISQISTGNKNTQDAISDGEYPFYIRSEEIMRSNDYSFDEEAILVPGEGRLGEIYHYVKGKYALHQRVYRIGNFADNAVGEFIYWNMRVYFKRHILRNTSSATAPSIRKPALENYELRIPPSKEEQSDIVNLLTYIDESIINTKNSINKLNKMKEYLLTNLFV